MVYCSISTYRKNGRPSLTLPLNLSMSFLEVGTLPVDRHNTGPCEASVTAKLDLLSTKLWLYFSLYGYSVSVCL